MRKRAFLPILFVLCGFIAAQTASAAQAAAGGPASRPATKKDLVGTWELVSVRPVHDAKDPVFYPYQRYIFKADSGMKYMTSDKPFTKEWLDKFRRQPSEIDFRMNERGLLTMIWEKRAHQENAVCAFVLRDIPQDVLAKLPAERRKGLPKKGDLTLSFLNSGGHIAYQKVLSRVE